MCKRFRTLNCKLVGGPQRGELQTLISPPPIYTQLELLPQIFLAVHAGIVRLIHQLAHQTGD